MHPLESPAGPEADLRHYARVVWRRKWTLVALVVGATVAAYLASSAKTPVYSSSADMLMRPRASEALFDQTAAPFYYNPTAIETEIQVLSSGPVAEEAARIAGYAGGVSGRQVGNTDIVRVTSQSTDPEVAAKVANAYVEAYIEIRQQQAVEDLANAVSKVQAKVGELQAQVNALDERLATFGAKESPESVSLRSDRAQLVSQQQIFQQQISSLQLNQELKTGGAQLIRRAVPASSPFAPQPRNDALTALATALVLGLALVFVIDHFDDRVRTKEDAERAMGSVPVVGMIPTIRGWRNRDAPRVVSRDEPSSPAAEAYRTLRTSIQFLGLDRPLRLLQVTSPSAGEGKTTTAANLATVLARAGQRVIVVCCDLRRPRAHEFFGVRNTPGFTSVLLGEVPLSEALVPAPGEPRLLVLPSGPPPPNPAELLTSRRTTDLLSALQANADIVVLDCPPVLPVTDAAVLAAHVDATLLVATARSTTKKALRRALELLGQVDARVVGLTLNGYDDQAGYGYGYRYRTEAYTPRSAPRTRASAPSKV